MVLAVLAVLADLILPHKPSIQIPKTLLTSLITHHGVELEAPAAPVVLADREALAVLVDHLVILDLMEIRVIQV